MAAVSRMTHDPKPYGRVEKRRTEDETDKKHPTLCHSYLARRVFRF